MTSQLPIRVRFAPSPTGMMHLGNVRAVLMNYLFAKQKNGTFILRIEDTDQQRNVDAYVTGILDDILWLKLDYDEGPIKGGHYEPYFQSQRNS
ncbi:MAG: glutamate--tRNA ligase family protein, partial [Candidatus Dependentiae bacterium]|nr:glutamate--tRNA ligase family protein [Candidatus Dependentiae bacterium]